MACSLVPSGDPKSSELSLNEAGFSRCFQPSGVTRSQRDNEIGFIWVQFPCLRRSGYVQGDPCSFILALLEKPAFCNLDGQGIRPAGEALIWPPML